MKHSITRVSVHRSSLTLGVLYGIFGVVYIPMGFLVNSASPADQQVPAIAIVLLPLIVFVLTYVAMAILFALYNGVAKVLGGVEVVLSGDSGSREAGGP